MYRYIALVVLLLAGSGFVTETLRMQQRDRDLENFTPEMQAEFDRLARLMHDPVPERRAEAVEGLRALGSLEATPLLVSALSDPNKAVLLKAIQALERFDYRIGAKGCERLAHLTRSADAEIRTKAERAAMKLCDWRAAPLIIAEAERANPGERQFLFSLLENCTSHVMPPEQRGADAAQSKQPSEAYLLMAWQDWFSKYKDGVPQDWLIDDLKSVSADGRARAAEALGRLRDAKTARPLMRVLEDKDEKACVSALRALEAMKARESEPSISALYLVSDGARAAECEKALRALAGAEHIQILAADLAKADKKKAGVYAAALEAASGHKKPEGADPRAFWAEYAAQVKGLTPLQISLREMKDKDARNRFEAVRRLKALGESAVPYLLKALSDEASAVRGEAAKSLKAITFYYVEFKAEGGAEERAEAAKKWQNWWESKKGEKASRRLIAQLQDLRDARNRVEAAIGVREIDSWEAVPYLIEGLSEESEALRFYCACALNSITKQGFDFVSNSPLMERNKAIALWRAWWGYGKSDKETALIETIRNIATDKSAKIRAIRALTEMGSKRAVERLANLLDDKSFVLSSIAEEALEKITGKSFFYHPVTASSDRISESSLWRRYIARGNEV